MAHQHRFVFACFGASLVLGARSSINVTSAMNTLQTYYDAKSGMYGKCPGYSAFFCATVLPHCLSITNFLQVLIRTTFGRRQMQSRPSQTMLVPPEIVVSTQTSPIHSIK